MKSSGTSLREVQNYRKALINASEHIEKDKKPISLHLIREAHALLMEGVRGGDKNLGQFRTEQNYIASPGSSIKEARFVPIAPESLSSALEKWENYIRKEDELDPLIQLAIIHVEFEAIHPFGDGNGRLGRMLIPLFSFPARSS